jgi:hypothetical protein
MPIQKFKNSFFQDVFLVLFYIPTPNTWNYCPLDADKQNKPHFTTISMILKHEIHTVTIKIYSDRRNELISYLYQNNTQVKK